MELTVIAALLACAAQTQDVHRPLPIGEPFEVVLEVNDRGFESKYPNQVFTFEPERDGTLYCWGECEDWGLVVHVEVAGDRETMKDSWFGPERPWPSVEYEVRRGEVYEVAIGSTKTDVAGTATIHAELAPEIDGVTEALAECRSMYEEIELDRSDLSSEEVTERLQAIMDRLDRVPDARRDRRVYELTFDLAEKEIYIGPPETVAVMWERCLEFRERVLPFDDLEQLLIEDHLAGCFDRLGRKGEARGVWERIQSIYDRRRTGDYQGIVARIHLAQYWKRQSEPEKSIPILEGAVARLPRVESMPPAVLFISYRQLLQDLSELRKWKKLLEHSATAVEYFSPHCKPRDLPLLLAKAHHANALQVLGNVPEFRTWAEEVWECRTEEAIRQKPVYDALLVLGTHLQAHGELSAARLIHEEVAEVMERLLGDDYPDTQVARGNLAITLKEMGDHRAALVIEEKLLAGWSRTMPDDDLNLQFARLNLGNTYSSIDRQEDSLALRQKAVDIWSSAESPPQFLLQKARLTVGTTLMNLGRISEALAITEDANARLAELRPPEDIEVQTAKRNLVILLRVSGDFERADEIEREILGRWEAQTDPPPDFQEVRLERLWTLALLEREEELADQLDQAREAVHALIRRAGRSSTRREVESSASLLLAYVSSVLSLSGPEDAAADFALCEALRGVHLVAAHTRHSLVMDDTAHRYAARIAEHSRELKRITAQEPVDREAWMTAYRAKEGEERRLTNHLAGQRGLILPEIDLERIRRGLGPERAAVAWWIYDHHEVHPEEAPFLRKSRRVAAFVIRPDRGVVRLDLGPVQPIAAASRRWNAEIMTGTTRSNTEAARAVARLLVDPLELHLEGIKKVTLLPDGVLHAIAFDALPLKGKRGLFGDRFRTHLRTTLRELELDRYPRPTRPRLLAIGGVDYDHSPTEVIVVDAEEQDEVAPDTIEASGVAQRIVRGGEGGKFTYLKRTENEVKQIAECFEEGPGAEEDAVLLLGRRASVDSLWRLAPEANYLHVATHGFFEKRSFGPAIEGDVLDAVTGVGSMNPLGDYIRGMSPMVLCGLAMAGANLEADSLGRLAGAMTAEELSMLDLSRCRLAVLSACDTNVGYRFSGRGVASLQRALHMAGAESVVTTLWEVESGAAAMFMGAFYDALWLEDAGPAKALCAARDRLRRKRAPVKDWAAWVLSGDPD